MRPALLGLLAVLWAAQAGAQNAAPAADPAPDATAPPASAAGLALTLDRVEPQAAAAGAPPVCQVLFVLHNALAGDIDRLMIETVLFDREGRVERLTMLDFQDMPQGRTRVRLFDLGGLDCDDLGGVLFNTVARCDGPGVAACAAALDAASRVGGVEVMQ